jgi:hypothetical protein
MHVWLHGPDGCWLSAQLWSWRCILSRRVLVTAGWQRCWLLVVAVMVAKKLVLMRVLVQTRWPATSLCAPCWLLAATACDGHSAAACTHCDSEQTTLHTAHMPMPRAPTGGCGRARPLGRGRGTRKLHPPPSRAPPPNGCHLWRAPLRRRPRAPRPPCPPGRRRHLSPSPCSPSPPCPCGWMCPRPPRHVGAASGDPWSL